MRQQYTSDEHTNDPFALPAPNSLVPPNSGMKRASARPSQPNFTQLGDVAALAHILVEDAPLDGSLTRALEIALRLLPRISELRLFAVDEAPEASASPLYWEASASRDAAGQIAVEPCDDMSDSLGPCEDGVRQILQDHRMTQIGDTQAMPLLAGAGKLVGVCLLRSEGRSPSQMDISVVTLVMDHLTVLLERWRHQRADQRATQAWQAALEAEGQERDTFISLAAHELRSPLTSLKGYAQLLIRQTRKIPLPDSMVRSVSAIEQQSVRMSDMIGELLDASRIQRGQLDLMPGHSDLVVAAKKVVERMRGVFPQHEIALELDAETLPGDWDAQRVEQILRDLLDNACRYSPESSVITVRIERQGAMALVSVRDQGVGINAEDSQHIFEYFYRAPSSERRNLSGLGLGLYICHFVVERLGGRLWLEWSSDQEPSGSEFRFTLPLAEQS